MALTVVLTRDPDGNRRWTAPLRRAGFDVVSAPLIEIVNQPVTIKIKALLSQMNQIDWLVFTSARAVPAIKSQLRQAGFAAAVTAPVAAIGPATAAAASAAGFNVRFQPRPATSAALGAQLEPVQSRRIMLARTAIADSALPAALRARGAQVTELPVYATRPRIAPYPALTSLLQSGRPAAAVFASPSAVASIAKLHPPALDLPALAIGPTTAAAARAAGFTSVHQAAGPNLRSIISALKLL